ncbi:protein kinase [Anaerolineales bacterium HSG6]|nr:protein kinase [Anaerolineales bacterium HSG6]MDM8531156.1 protein kinase [Anaerolineales bacterium HSG25]
MPPRIGSYPVIDHIGYGLQADVYKIEYSYKGYRQAVLKQFRPTADHWQQQLNNEYLALKKLSQGDKPATIPAILQQNPTQRYLIMEYLPGRPMHVPQNKRKAFVWWFKIAETIIYAHEHGVFHCDINPNNVLVKREAVYLIDWALSVRQGNVKGIKNLPRGAWQPPEQAQGQFGRKTDVYSLSALLLWLISGNKPRDPIFQGRERRSKRIIQGVITHPLGTTNCRDLAIHLEKGLAGDVGLRYNSTKRLYTAIRNWFEEYS